MTKYDKMDNYLIFKELNTDSIGTNYRAGEIVDNQARKHVLLTQVYPYFYSSEEVWNRINTLLQGIKKSNIPNLYSPEKILRLEDKVLLIYPLVMGKTFEQILKDSTEKEVPINFDLAFSIAIAISDLVDIGSSIVVSGQKSFHGFLTPDNILIDYDGKIMLKNYGIYPYLGQSKQIYDEMEKKYGTWLTPEFLRREKIIYQSDVYHLGYLVFRMLTGNYFAYNQNENFDAKFANISFSHHIPHTEKDFLSNIIHFFKHTLNPDPTKRFSTVKEAKDYISNYFRIDELSSVTFSLAYFMNSLYLEHMEEEKKILKKELEYEIPEEKEEVVPDIPAEAEKDGHLVESILDGLEEKDTSKSKNIIIIATLFVVVIAVAIFFYLSSTKKAKETQIQTKQELDKKFEERMKEQQRKYEQQMKAIKSQIATTEAEKQAQADAVAKLEQELADQKKRDAARAKAEKDRLQKLEEERKRKAQEDLDKKRKAEEERKKKEDEARKKQQEIEKQRQLEAQKVKQGDTIALADATVKPEEIRKKKDVPSILLKRKYKNKTFAIPATILIDENGDVIKVKIFGGAPKDVKSFVERSLKARKYKPAQKDDVKVKVWYTVSYKLAL